MRRHKAERYFVSRQQYWDRCEGDGTIVEVAIGGIDYANADMVGVKWPHLGEGKEFTDPREAVEAAILVRDEWKKTDPNAHVAMGATMGFTLTFDWEEDDALRQRAKEMYDKLPKCDECMSLLGDDTYTHDLVCDGERFCREYCAEKHHDKILHDQYLDE